ncbi:MAG: DUF4157 domain-containing protein [Nitrospira sp.]|nr:DUF4157 domain-containing protein [Nitrospira sp.]
MTVQSIQQPVAAKTMASPSQGLLQRPCACGGSAGLSGECEDCAIKKLLGQPLQKKWQIGAPDDEYEQEADRVADQVMRMPDTSVHHEARSSSSMPLVQRTVGAGRAGVGAAPAIVHDVLSSPGQPLDQSVRNFFEPRFAHDFGRVRIHADTQSGESARAIDALAYTSGRAIVFAAGHYAPHTSSGRRLLAHELAHTLQQGGLQTSSRLQRQCATGSACAGPIPGDPGRFNASEHMDEEPDRSERERESREDPAAVTRSGHGRRAVHLESLAAAERMDLSGVYGIFVDLDMSPGSGATSGQCRSLEGMVPRFSGPRHARCVFVPDELEVSAGEAMATPAPDAVGGYPRRDWVQWIREIFAHESQHIRFDTAPHPEVEGGSCSRSTALYVDSTGYAYDVDFYLSELSAILAEFNPIFESVRRHTRSGAYGELLDNLRDAYGPNLLNPHESISGILTALRCHCECGDVDALVRDTFVFTSSGWSSTTRGVFVDFVQSRYPILQWPDT